MRTIISIMVLLLAVQGTWGQASKFPFKGVETSFPEPRVYINANKFIKSGSPQEPQVALENRMNENNNLVFEGFYYSMNVQLLAEIVPGVFAPDDMGIRFKPYHTSTMLASRPNAVFKDKNFRLTKNGFTVAFWTKWPKDYPADGGPVKVLSVEDKNKTSFWEVGIAHDQRVYVKRQASLPNGNTSPKFWNLKFWSPEHTDVENWVASHNSPNGGDWIFVMLVQEKTQVRLHIGLPDGKFDCMYLNYGLEDQKIFDDPDQRLMFFGALSEQLYLDELVIWDMPLCRNEAFEYFKVASHASGKTFNFAYNTSSQQSVVSKDDNDRMKRDAGRTGGCLTGGDPHPRAVIAPLAGLDAFASTGKGISVYPNPASSAVNINLPAELKDYEGAVELVLTDLKGVPVRKENLQLYKGQTTLSWSIPQQQGIVNGLYMISVQAGAKRYTQKIAVNCGCN